MILLSDIADASFNVRRRAKQTRAFERGEHVLVVPLDDKKQFRLVSFLPNEFVICTAYETGEACEANAFGRVCYHAVAGHKRREINRKRRETLKARRSLAA